MNNLKKILITISINILFAQNFATPNNKINDILNNKENNLIILDVREKWEYDICHIKESVHIPMGQIAERKDELNMEDTIIVVCHHGIRSRMIAKHLINLGFEKIINLSSGLEGWSNDVDRNMNKYA